MYEPMFLIGCVVGLLIAFIVHEYAHAQAAYALGDPTAKYDGRLTLNPLVHLDPVGSICMLVSTITSHGSLVLGWAKPVVFNRDNFRNPFVDAAIVAIAGPLVNFVVAFAVALAMAVGVPLGEIGVLIVKYNVGFGLFNSFPLPPLDGWKILQAVVPRSMARSMSNFEERLGVYAPVLLLVASFLLIGPIFRPLFTAITGLLLGLR